MLKAAGVPVNDSENTDRYRKGDVYKRQVFLCTGRNLRMTKPLLAYGFDGFVCSAGGYVEMCIRDRRIPFLPATSTTACGARLRTGTKPLFGPSVPG